MMASSIGTLPAYPTRFRPRIETSNSQQRRGSLLPSKLRGGILQRPLSAPSVSEPLASRRIAAQKQQFGSFDQMIKESELPVLVDFYATWCGPCQMMARTLEAVAPSLQGKVKLVKIDSEKYDVLASKHNIQGLPTLILYKNGKQVDRLEGMLPQADFMRWLQRWL